jgi:ATPase
MSVHLKTGSYPQAKKGKPGDWKLSTIGEKKLLREDLVQLESSILLEVENDPESFIEKEMKGVTVVQLKNYRIVMCRPPFSNTHEITAVKPLVRFNLNNYKTTPHIIRRLEKAEGILVAGSPGAGKSTFISALAEFYLKKGKVIKTLESVRDLQVPPEISQYTELENDFEKTADILLLVRPDYTIFDEIRTSSDFKIFTDMRLAGVGMIGVIHASSALDAIQRFIRRIELGIIPSVLDTVILIKKGDIAEILKIEITVKIPSGFRDQGLARPVINISDYITDKLLYEIYEFGSNVVVIPVKSKSSYYNQYSNENNRYQTRTNYSGGKKKKKRKKDSSPGLTRGNSLIHSAANDDYDDILDDLDAENDYNPDYNNDPFEPDPGSAIDFKLIYGKKSLVLRADLKFIGKYIDIYSGKDFISSVTVNQKGEIRINKNTHLFHKLDNGIREGKKIYGKKTK